METKLTFDLLPVLSVLLVVLAWFFPGVKVWYSGLSAANKQLAMLAILFGITLGTVLLSYFGFLDIYNGETWKEWVWYPVVDFVIAMCVNAGAYKSANYLPKENRDMG